MGPEEGRIEGQGERRGGHKGSGHWSSFSATGLGSHREGRCGGQVGGEDSGHLIRNEDCLSPGEHVLDTGVPSPQWLPFLLHIELGPARAGHSPSQVFEVKLTAHMNGTLMPPWNTS